MKARKRLLYYAVKWDGKWDTLKEMFPIENAVRSVSFDRETGELIIYTHDDGAMKAVIGNWIVRNNNGYCLVYPEEVFNEEYEIIE